MSHSIEVPTRFNKKLWVFPAESKLKAFLQAKVNLESNKKILASMSEGPFSFLTLIILVRSIISRDRLYDKANPVIIVCDNDLKNLVNKEAFHISTLTNELIALVVKAEGTNLPLETERTKLIVVTEEDGRRALRAVSFTPSWGASDCYWNMVRKKRSALLSREFIGTPDDKLYQISDTLRMVIFPLTKTKYYPPTIVEKKLIACLQPLGAPKSTEVIPVHLNQELSQALGGIRYLHKSQISLFVDYHLTKPSRAIRCTTHQAEKWLDESFS